MKTKFFFLAFCIFPVLLTAHIIEITRLEEILQHIQPDEEKTTLVVFDIDNTLLKATQQLGSVAWGDDIAKNLENKRISKREAQEVVSVLWRTVQPHIKVQAVDPHTQSIIRKIQSQNIPIMCLTARKPQEAEYTRSQLQSIGIDLSSTRLTPAFEQFFHLTSDTLYDEGILFATPLNKKSQVFISFLEKTKINLKRVIFVDDKMEHVKDVKEALNHLKIECIGIRFGGADEDVRQFNPLIAKIQWDEFPRLVSDEEAYQMIKK